MSWLQGLFFTPWSRPRLSSLVDRVTARSQNAVWLRVKDRLGAMSVHQARGYIRARAAAVLEREMAIAYAEMPALTTDQSHAVLADARNRIVRRLLLENIRLQQQATAPQRRRRAA